MKTRILKIEITTGNAAFDGDDYPRECARILRRMAARMEDGNFPGTLKDSPWGLFDINGNRAGMAGTAQRRG